MWINVTKLWVELHLIPTIKGPVHWANQLPARMYFNSILGTSCCSAKASFFCVSPSSRAWQRDWRMLPYLPSLVQCPYIYICGHFQQKTPVSIAPVLRVDHSRARGRSHPWQNLSWPICHAGGSSSSGEPKQSIMELWQYNHDWNISIKHSWLHITKTVRSNLSRFFPPRAFRCLWRKSTSIALEKIADKQRTATP